MGGDNGNVKSDCSSLGWTGTKTSLWHELRPQEWDVPRIECYERPVRIF